MKDEAEQKAEIDAAFMRGLERAEEIISYHPAGNKPLHDAIQAEIDKLKAELRKLPLLPNAIL